MEIERKYLLKKLPDDLEAYRHRHLEQGYLCTAPVVRIRKDDDYQDKLLDLPVQIDEANYNLMIRTMEMCYEVLQVNTKEIDEIGEWINKVRIELKKNIVRKQEKEIKNHELYSYMHDVFGADVVEIFDISQEFVDKIEQKNAEKYGK